MKKVQLRLCSFLLFAVVAGLAATLFPVPPARAQELAAVPIGTFDRPVHVAVAPGYPRLLFVVEQGGRIAVLRDERKLATPFLDISDLVFGPGDAGAGGEQGLLSVAFAPDYATSRRFYVVYTNLNWDVVVAEFRRSTSSAVRASRASRRVLLVIRHRGAQNHNGGQLQFGPDGRLYISVGDGGRVTPTGEAARDLNSLLGKLLRIDPLPSGSLPYGIPSDNPFVGENGRDEIYAYGLRNPWRFSFDDWRLALSDVGQGRQEEVNILSRRAAAGANFGWPEYEGDLIFDASRPGPHPPTFPIHTYDHGNGECAIIGGYIVRDPELPTLAGRYLYADRCIGDIRTFIPRIRHQRAVDDSSTGLTLGGLTSFGLGFNGQLYAAHGGTVSRLEPPQP